MPEVMTRRTLLAAGAGAAATAFVPQVRARSRVTDPRDLEKVEHIVVLMQENQSFDHYFGTLKGVRGFSDPGRRSVFRQPDPAMADGYLAPWHFDASAYDPCLIQVDNGWESRHAAIDGGRMDGFVTGASGSPNHFPMAYHRRADVPWHMALADAFTVCDAYHCSVLGPTYPNRIMMMTGTIDPQGRGGGPVISDDVQRWTWTTYPERLTKAGVSWRVYHEADDFGDNVLKYFAQYQDAKPGSPLYDNAMVNLPPDQFEQDVAADRLPQVSWILTNGHDSEHAKYSAPALGADKCNRIMRAFREHPKVWAKTALIFTYDEDGGYFDHVLPPLPPAGTAGEFVNGLPIGLGLRVPTVVCSPWTRGGYVCSQVYDHTSLIRMIERRFGVVEPQISAWRRQTCGDMWECFDFTKPDHSFPELPSTTAAAARTSQACGNHPTAPAPAHNAALPIQERGTRPRRPCTHPSRPVSVRVPRTPPGQRLLGATIAVTGRKTRRLTGAELRDHRVVLRGLPAGTTVDVVIRLHRRKGSARRTVVVRRTLRIRCPA